MGGKRWTCEEDTVLERMVTADNTYAEIAQALGRTCNSVAIRAERRCVTKWSAARDKQLIDLVSGGSTMKEIAAEMGFTVHSVYLRASRGLGIKFGKDPIPAELSVLPLELRSYLWHNRILPRVSLSDSGCMLWQGSTNPDGYGTLGAFGKTFATHRVSFEAALGRLLGPDELACHECDTPACCNPAHMFVGDDAANCTDKILKGRHNPKATPAVVLAIRSAYPQKSMTELASEYSLAISSVSEIVRGISHKHI